MSSSLKWKHRNLKILWNVEIRMFMESSLPTKATGDGEQNRRALLILFCQNSGTWKLWISRISRICVNSWWRSWALRKEKNHSPKMPTKTTSWCGKCSCFYDECSRSILDWIIIRTWSSNFEDVGSPFTFTENIVNECFSEIMNVSNIDFRSSWWTNSTLAHEQVKKWYKAKVRVYSDSEFCLGKMPSSEKEVVRKRCYARWKKAKRFVPKTSFMDSMEKQLNSSRIFHRIYGIANLERNPDRLAESECRTRAIPWQSYSCRCSMTLNGNKEGWRDLSQQFWTNKIICTTISARSLGIIIGPGDDMKWYGIPKLQTWWKVEFHSRKDAEEFQGHLTSCVPGRQSLEPWDSAPVEWEDIHTFQRWSDEFWISVENCILRESAQYVRSSFELVLPIWSARKRTAQNLVCFAKENKSRDDWRCEFCWFTFLDEHSNIH